MPLVIGFIVLLVSVAFVVLMAVSEWSGDGAKQAAPAPSPEPLPGKGGARKKAPAKKAAKKAAKKKK